MGKLKERITENGIDYILVEGYYIPDLKLPEPPDWIFWSVVSGLSEAGTFGTLYSIIIVL